MSVIDVRAPGLLTTVQDAGRDGFGTMGVSVSGAADPVALRIGNRLVGNAESAAGLEMTLLGGTFIFSDGGAFALTGADFGANLDDQSIEMWASVEVRPNQTLHLGATRAGARCYLCVKGGIDVKLFLGSASTHLLSGLGGLEGRALRKGDVLKIGTAGGTFRTFRKRKVSERALQKLAPRKVLRVTAGPQSGWFSEAAQKAFYESTYRVAEESNRMGLRLEGGAIAEAAGANGGEMVSEGVSLGAVQITASGLPIILFVEQQTTGGYPKIANVISADLSSLGQLRPRDEIRFERVEMDTARALLAKQENLLASKELILE
ncbi:MAG: biotin-dependent carboxyltransferase family protein [Candidatus Acidiferrum sp.]